MISYSYFRHAGPRARAGGSPGGRAMNAGGNVWKHVFFGETSEKRVFLARSARIEPRLRVQMRLVERKKIHQVSSKSDEIEGDS